MALDHSPEFFEINLANQNFLENFWKESLQEHFYEIISKSDQ